MNADGVPTLRLAVLQTDALLEDPAANASTISDAAARVRADLTVTPELSLTGYHLEAAAASLARPVRTGEPIEGVEALAAAEGELVVGLPERSGIGPPHNCAAVLARGRVRHRHRKRYLPTYGMFDEARFFAPGEELETYVGDHGWRVGILICEDLWHPSLPYLLALEGAQVIAVLAAAAGRGAWSGGETGRFASWDHWVRLARVTAQTHGVYLALANRAGVEGPITFAGGSLIVGPDGGILAEAGADPGAVLEAVAERDALDAARASSPHARDEDPRWLAERLRRAPR
ncbi:MAG TPA: nitrilase-related carbon-nitrogen hydrolase [Longimicrobiales bacterium]|nr:nitrilase-related carbon-nitrogen hydrolase [Longimicrobiales bacterium]